MSLICLSYSHHHTPIQFREQVYFDANSAANACARFRCGEALPGSVVELSILSTCNRTEVYAFCESARQAFPVEESQSEILQFIHDARKVDPDQLADLGRWKTGPDVVNHLNRVACGLESLVLGEPQILGQVGDAMRLGLIMNSSGPVLTRLFQSAIRAGRRARTETQIGRHSTNIATVAVNTAERELQTFDAKTVVVLGAGEMADLALSQLQKKGAANFKIVNRTIAKARELASRYDGDACVFEQIDQLLPQADILIASTGAPHTLVTHEMLEFAMQKRQSRPMMVLDIAVPRDVETSVEQIPGVKRCDIDDLQMVAGHSVSLRRQQIPQVEEIIQVENDRFLQWFRGIGAEETIVSLRRKAADIRDQELARLSNLLPELDQDSWQVVEKFADSLVKKLLHDPTIQLRDAQGTRDGIDHGEAIRRLFRLESQSSQPANEANH